MGNDPSNKVIIELLSGPMDGTEFEISGSEIHIGRDPQNDVAVPLDNRVSRSHALLTCINGKWHIRDLKSRNGTFSNGKLVEDDAIIGPDDTLKTGVTEFKIILYRQ